MITQINVFVCEQCFAESIVINKGLDIWNEPTVTPPDGEKWGYVGERLACPACVEKSRSPDRLKWLNGWPRDPETTQIEVGIIICCVGCGRRVAPGRVVSPNLRPNRLPDWPFPEEDCPVCSLAE